MLIDGSNLNPMSNMRTENTRSLRYEPELYPSKSATPSKKVLRLTTPFLCHILRIRPRPRSIQNYEKKFAKLWQVESFVN